MIRTAFYISDFNSIDLGHQSSQLLARLASKSVIVVSSKNLDEIKRDIRKKIEINKLKSEPDYSRYIVDLLNTCNYLTYDQVRNRALKFESRTPSEIDLKQKAIVCWCITDEDHYVQLSGAHNNDQLSEWFTCTDCILVTMSGLEKSMCTEEINRLSRSYPTHSNTQPGSPLMEILGDLIRSHPTDKNRGIHIHDPYTMEGLKKSLDRDNTEEKWEIYNMLKPFGQANRPLEINIYTRYYEDSSSPKKKHNNFNKEDDEKIKRLFKDIFREFRKNSKLNFYVASRTTLDAERSQKIHRRFILINNQCIDVDKYSSNKNEMIKYTLAPASEFDWKHTDLHRDSAIDEGRHLSFEVGST